MPSKKGHSELDHAHDMIHDGHAFHTHYTRTTANSDDDRTGIGFITPSGIMEAHLVISVFSTSPAELFLIEAPTIDAGEGTEQVIYNRNRNSDLTSLLTSQEVVPVAGKVTRWNETQFAGAQYSAGTELDYLILAGGEGKKAPGGSSRGAQEWILDMGLEYLIFLQNIGANANTHYISLDWYEEFDLS